LAEIVRLVGYVAGGLPGARLLARSAILTSDDTVLRRVKVPSSATLSSNPPMCVSAGAKIPIMPVEKSPPPYVVNRSLLRTEEVPRLVKGERRARDQRTATARDEHPRDQPVDRLGSQNHSQI